MGAAAPAPTVAAQTGTLQTPQPTATYQPSPQPVAAQPAPFNVNQAAAGALQGAIGGTRQAMNAPLQVGAYMNPYQQEVIDRTQQDIERQRQMAMNTLGAQATRAGAFGGSRQGVAEGVMAGEYGRMAGDIAAQQRQTGYTQAMDAAMRDRAARASYASQLGGLGRQAFQTGQDITAAQERQGLMQQALQQTLIDAARQQYAGYTGAPQASLAAPLAALGVVPNQSTTTKSGSPGLMSYLQMAAMLPKLCWVAREVYGEDDPRWMEFRDWVVGHSPDWFFNAYDKYGERVAKIVKKVPILKSIIRPFMDAKRKAIGYK
jgi:hypothetical protein